VLEAGRQGLLESKVQLSWCLYIGGKVCAVDGSEIGILATILIGKPICGGGKACMRSRRQVASGYQLYYRRLAAVAAHSSARYEVNLDIDFLDTSITIDALECEGFRCVERAAVTKPLGVLSSERLPRVGYKESSYTVKIIQARLSR
jgi:hypothetical protein